MQKNTHSIWSPGFIGTVCLKNRILRSAVNDAQADAEGMCRPVQYSIPRELAASGVGGIITGHIYVHRSGMAGNRQLGLDNDRQITGLAVLAQVVHEAGGIIFSQLSHAGSQADIYLAGRHPVSPSSRIAPGGSMRTASSQDDLAMIIEAFALAARRARQAGFDGIEVHAAHGYLLSEFLSPALNKRLDSYGGSVENRARMLMEVCRAIRAEVGYSYPLLVKINSEDSLAGGMSRSMMRETIHLLKAENLLDAVEISGLWGANRVQHGPVDAACPGAQAYAYEAAVEFRKTSSLPLILVGGIHTLPAAKFLIENNIVDFVSMARPLVRNPRLISSWWKQDKQCCQAPEQIYDSDYAENL